MEPVLKACGTKFLMSQITIRNVTLQKRLGTNGIGMDLELSGKLTKNSP
jgi:hypothetical protein